MSVPAEESKGHIHTHFIVNSVNYENGHKLQWSKHDLKDLKERCNEQSWEQGLHVPEKGKTFAGEVREETVAWSKQTRIHRDIDINFDAQHTEKLLNVLLNLGYKIDTDWKPVRIELYSDELGYLDIHPFVLNEDGTSKQADLEGGWYEFEKDYFGSVFFEGKTIPCISLKGQKVFHSGYELRDKDKHDISILESLSK